MALKDTFVVKEADLLWDRRTGDLWNELGDWAEFKEEGDSEYGGRSYEVSIKMGMTTPTKFHIETDANGRLVAIAPHRQW